MNPRELLLVGLHLGSLAAGGFAAVESLLASRPHRTAASGAVLNDHLTRKAPARRLGQEALVLHEDSDLELCVLLLDPADREGCILPGGGAEADELPHLAARRHLEILTGLVLPLRTVLTVDYVARRDQRDHPEELNLVYAGGVVTARQARVTDLHRLPPDIRALHWIPRHLLDTVMRPEDAGRVRDAWDAWEHGDGRPLLLRGTPVPVC